MKYDRKEIKRLRGLGLTVREIQKRLGISSPSVVQHHLKYMSRFSLLIFPERHPVEGDKQSALMCAGFNEYRRMIIEKLKQLNKD